MQSPHAKIAVSVLASVFAALTLAQAQLVQIPQTISLKGGSWNAVFVEVAPTNTLAEIFVGWPTDSVGLYDPAAFLATRQFSANSESEGILASPIAMWHRDYPEASDAMSLPANTVCIFYNTNKANSTLTVRGVPAAPRTTWHVTGPKSPYNYFGVSLQSGTSALAADYMEGFTGSPPQQTYHMISGVNSNIAPKTSKLYTTDQIHDGQVILASSTEVSDWSGVLFVSPMDGLDFGTNATKRMLSIRNDSTLDRVASVDLVPVAGFTRDLRPALHIRDMTVALTNAAWITPETSRLASKTLAPGETWKLEFGLDRSYFDSDIRGTPFGAVLRIIDDGGASKLRVDVPIQGAASGGSSDRNAWPGGLWIAEAAFDEISFDGDRDAGYTPAGGTLKVRLPLHIDAEGNVRLLQRVVVAGATAADGTFAYTLYAGDAAVPATSRETMRISSAVLPTEQPVIPATTTMFSDGIIMFSFTVDENGATSILRHPTHPQHDGLRWDFETPAPSGNDFQNYKSTVKPELFSVDNTILFDLDFNGGEASWNPEEEKSGTCAWQLRNLRREGDIILRGPMTIRRIAPQTDIVFE
ncbi:MAG: hypothetical protein ILO10_08555 [Kiritimatiellae bacterium]|nr:hypothetical protein [Kiritimatiellia bacterium]